MFEEVGRLAVKGDIMTANQAEQMIDSKLKGAGMDYVLSRKVHEKCTPFGTFMSGLASKHEVRPHEW
jgi:hypothetical protein